MEKYIVDGHSDILLNYLRDKKYDISKDTDFHVDLPKLEKGNIGLEVFAVCPAVRGIEALKKTIQLIDKFKQLEEKTEKIEQVKNYSDIKKIIGENKIAALLAVEGADGIFDLSTLRILYYLGVRLITLTWNYQNKIADGILEIEADGGVTQFGKRFIKEMNRLGIIIDVSHLTPASFWDVIKYSESPIVASHSNVKNICNHPRNLNDEQIIALAEKNGLIGINFCPEFLKNSGKASIKNIVEHIKYIKELVGIKHVALGSDFDGISETPDNLEDISKMPGLIEELKNANFTDEEIAYITRINWLKLFKRVMK